ncbi:MAG: hypothetical protein KAJ03_10920, partial [Gammaproteobacteria bacterium]|nr:hypothetical protein [Gammaproteobacteria bacterium]
MKIDDVIYEDRVPRSELMETTYFNTHDSPRRQFVITPAGVAGIAGSYKVRTSIPDPQVVADMTYHTLDELKLLSEHERIPQDFKVKERQPGKIEPVIPVNRILGTIAVTQGLGKRHSDVLGKIRTVTGRGQMRKRDVDNTQKYMGKNKTPRTEYFLNSQATRDLLVAYKWTPDSEVHDRYLHHYFTELINGPVKVEMGPDERDFKSPNQEEVVREEEPGVIKEATKEEIKEFIEEATKEEIEEDISEAIDTWAESAAASVKTAEPPAWHQEAEHPIPPIDSTALRDEALHILKTELEIAKAMGVPKNRVLEDIVINIKNQTGLDYRHLLQELPEDICDIKEKKMLSVIDLGKL